MSFSEAVKAVTPMSMADLAAQRVIGHGVHGFDDMSVVFEQIVNERRAPCFVAGDHLLDFIQPQQGPFRIQRQARVWLLHFAQLIGFVRRQKIALLGRQRQASEAAPSA